MYKTSLTSLKQGNTNLSLKPTNPKPSTQQRPVPSQPSQQVIRPVSNNTVRPVQQQQPTYQQAPPSRPVQAGPPPSRPVQAAPPSRQQPAPPSRQQPQQRLPPESGKVEPLFECPEGCGRSFNQVALPKHAKVCKKVFQQKRKEFNSAKQRLIEEEQLKKTQTARGGKARPTTATTRQAPAAQKPAPKKVDWRAQSEAFRAVVKSAKGGTMTKEQSQMVSQAMNSNLVPCKYCGRTFNEAAASKHIPVCERKAKENKIKMGTQQLPPPSKAVSKVPVQPAPKQQPQSRLMSGTQRNKPY